MSIVTHVLTLAASIALAAYLLPGVTGTIIGVCILAVALAFVNTFIRPIIKIIALPITILTLGLFSLVINIGLIVFVTYFAPDIFIDSLRSAILFALIVSVVNALLSPLRRA